MKTAHLQLALVMAPTALPVAASPLLMSTCMIYESGVNVASGYDSGVITQTVSKGSTSCFAGGASAAGYASSYLPFAVVTTQYSFAPGSIQLFQQNSVSAGEIPTYNSVSAQSTIEDTEQLATEGPVRAGKLLIYIQNDGIGPVDNRVGGAGISFSNLSPDVNQNFFCSFGGFSPSCYYDALNHYDNEGGFDVQLGTSFSLSVTSYIASYNDNGFDSNGNGSGTLDEKVSFQFTELDGTPVALVVTPEPGSKALLLLGVIPIWLARRRQATQSRS